MITGMNHITLAVKDIDKSFNFYSGIIGLKPLVKWDKGAYFLDPDDHKLEIHVGNWQVRISAKKENPSNWKNVEWFV